MQAAQDGLNTTAIWSFVKTQIDYVLGKNSLNLSYMVGFGNNFPLQPHHSGASCPADHNIKCGWSDFHSSKPNPNVVHGAIVGGPDAGDNFDDSRDNYVQNEVSLNYNAGFQGLLAAAAEGVLQSY